MPVRFDAHVAFTRGRQASVNWARPAAIGLRFFASLSEFMTKTPGADAYGAGFYDAINRIPLLATGPGLVTVAESPSRTGYGLKFNGSTGFLDPSPIDIGMLNSLDKAPITFACKLRSATGANRQAFAKSSSANSHMLIGMSGVSTLRIFVTNTGATSVKTYADNQWYTVFGFWDGAVNQLAIFNDDGILQENIVRSAAVTTVSGTFTPLALRIGQYNNVNGASGWLGDIEWSAVWRNQFSVAQMSQIASDPYSILRPLTIPVEIFIPLSEIDPTGIASDEAFGTATLTDNTIISPTGIASAEAFGTPSLSATITATGIASAEAFGTAIIQGAIEPSGIATAEAIGANLHIGDLTPSAIDSAEALGTPTLIAGDIGAVGIASAEDVPFPEVVDEPGAAGTITLTTGIASEEAFGTATLETGATISPIGIPSGEDMDLHHVGVDVATIAPFGIASEEAFADVTTSALGTAIGGTNIFTLENPTPPAPGTITTKRLCSPLTLLRAEIYDTAPSPADILPDVYGDFIFGGLRGPSPAVLVTQTSPWIFVAAAHPVQAITNVYIDDIEQTGGFVTNPAIALGGGPQVAIIAFTEQPAGPVSWRGQGRMYDDGTLIRNPIDQLQTLLKDRAGFFDSDFDASTLAESRSDAEDAGWELAWVFRDDRQIQDWITEVMFNLMGFWRISGFGQLQLTLDPGLPFDQADLVASIVAAHDCIDGDDGVVFIADRQHLVNKLEAFYVYSFSLDQPSSRLSDLDDPISQNAYGENRKSVTLRGLRNEGLVRQWANILFARQGFGTRVEGGTVEFTVAGSKLMHATIGDLLAFSWPYGPVRENGHEYVNEIIRIVTITHDLTRGGSSKVTCLDTGAFANVGGERLTNPVVL